MTRHGIPTNCFRRVELQRLIECSLSLGRDTTSREMCQALQHLAKSLATVDAILAQRQESLCHGESGTRYLSLYAGNSTLSYEWRESRHSIHTGRGLFFLALGQEVMLGEHGLCIGTNRYRLRLADPDDPPIYATNLGDLRPRAEDYLRSFEGVMPGDTAKILDMLFGDKDILEVRHATNHGGLKDEYSDHGPHRSTGEDGGD